MDMREINRYLHDNDPMYFEDGIIREAVAETTKWEDYDTIECADGEVIDMQKLLKDQANAEAACRNVAPFFGAYITKLQYVYTFRVQTQATDGKHLFVNPQFTYHLSFEEKVAVMLHEVMHCLLYHLRRRQSRDPYKTNIAGDYEVNVTLSDEMDIIPASVWKNMGGLYDKKYLGWGFERIYDDNPKGPNDDMNNDDDANKSKQNQGQPQDGDGDGEGGSGAGGEQDDYAGKSDAYKAGWEQAMKDIESGKIKL